ncbi:MAG TPA: type II toxin-antitoxin system mRNA interferase toxin, RelE/StbE family [Desulfobacteraceae bacterium]|nr:type II toxin-antitoxin system mRNA interferase toxin, RelE/StbE family [Desulfobacteraceae bacterium]
MLPIRPTSRFKKDLKKARKQGRALEHLSQVLEHLVRMEPLPPSYNDHKLKGTWRDFRECHIEPDWLLIYTITDFELRPARLGSHVEIFG